MRGAALSYLTAYPAPLQAQVASLLEQGKLADLLRAKYTDTHEVRTDRALYQYVLGLKADCLRSSDPLSKVVFDNKLHVIRQALGTHTYVSRVQGSKLKTKNEIRIAALFREVPSAFLKMIVVHELAHLREKAHDKAFYKLCTTMQPDYHQVEFDLRMYLTYLDAGGTGLWGGVPTPAKTPAG